MLHHQTNSLAPAPPLDTKEREDVLLLVEETLEAAAETRRGGSRVLGLALLALGFVLLLAALNLMLTLLRP